MRFKRQVGKSEKLMVSTVRSSGGIKARLSFVLELLFEDAHIARYRVLHRLDGDDKDMHSYQASGVVSHNG